jgi:hypothetical protein
MTRTLASRPIAGDAWLVILHSSRGWTLVERQGIEQYTHGTYATAELAMSYANDLLAAEELVSGIEQERF